MDFFDMDLLSIRQMMSIDIYRLFLLLAFL